MLLWNQLFSSLREPCSLVLTGPVVEQIFKHGTIAEFQPLN